MTSRLISQPFVIAGAIIERMGRDTLRDQILRKWSKIILTASDIL